ncbi:MAG: plastocyanin/azurin family copper-binding protein [Gemmatimonadales bacterium]
MTQWKFVALSAAIACIAACGGSSGNLSTGPTTNPTNPPPPPASNTVTLANQLFSPSTITIAKGAAVTWYWNDCGGSGGYGTGTCVQHSVVFDDGSNGSPLQDTGTFVRTFNTSGTFTYHCAVHGAAMTGKVVVN